MSDYEKEEAIYDWQMAYTAYNDNSLAPIASGGQYSHLPYGVFKYHQAICVGHAAAFVHLCFHVFRYIVDIL